jgi:hypothetical protein
LGREQLRPHRSSAINLRAVGNFVALTAAGAIANTGISTYNGDIATGLGAITAFDTAKVNGKFYPDGDVVIIMRFLNATLAFIKRS